MGHLPEATKVACNECPWRRESAPGWLGPMDADEWVALVHSEEAIACHITIEEEGDWTTPGIRQCAGAATYRGNVCKRPRDPEVALLPADRDKVFATPGQFLEHHTADDKDYGPRGPYSDEPYSS